MRGFSRETIIEVTTNIESQEFRRRQNQEIGYVENPRASETDDLECFYGMCHTWLGPYFTLKDFKLKWRKIVRYVHVWDPVNIVATSISYAGFTVGKKCSEFVPQN